MAEKIWHIPYWDLYLNGFEYSNMPEKMTDIPYWDLYLNGSHYDRKMKDIPYWNMFLMFRYLNMAEK